MNSLETLLQQITPLPLVRFGDKRETFITGLMPDGVSNSDPIATCYSKSDARPIAAYLVHAANVLPELVKALEDCEQSLSRLDDKDGAYRMTCLQQAQKALSIAKNIKLP
jgi:hypothetical protein